MKAYKNILVPVDFNPASENAMAYVSNYAQDEDHILLIHVVSQGFSGADMIHTAQPLEDLKALLEKKKEKFFPEYKHVEARIVFDPIGPVDGICKAMEEFEADAIFIGTRDQHDVFDKLFGSTCLGVNKNANCDVVVIPPKASYRDLKTIVFAADMGVSELLTADRLLSWNGKKVLFAHVGDPDDAFNDEKKNVLSRIFQENDVSFAFGIEIIESQDKVKSLLSYAHNEKADAIVMTKSRQSLISTLFLKSVTKEMIEKATLPIVFINQN